MVPQVLNEEFQRLADGPLIFAPGSEKSWMSPTDTSPRLRATVDLADT